MPMKICAKCSLEQSEEEFYPRTGGTRRGTCRTCMGLRHKRHRDANRDKVAARRNRWAAANRDHLKVRAAVRRLTKRAMCLIAAARVRARKKGLPFDLDLYPQQIDDALTWGKCQLSNVPFDLSPGRTFASPSIHRIRPELGYVRSNVLVVCQAMNTALGDWGEEPLKLIVRGWLAGLHRAGRPA